MERPYRTASVGDTRQQVSNVASTSRDAWRQKAKKKKKEEEEKVKKLIKTRHVLNDTGHVAGWGGRGSGKGKVAMDSTIQIHT